MVSKTDKGSIKKVTPTVSPIRMKGVTQRLDVRSDFDEQASFKFVGPTATQKEKLLKMRADLIANEPGIKVNGFELSQPSSRFMK